MARLGEISGRHCLAHLPNPSSMRHQAR